MIMKKKATERKGTEILRHNSILFTILIPFAACMIVILIAFFVLIEMLMMCGTKAVAENEADRALKQAGDLSDTLLEHYVICYNRIGKEEIEECLQGELQSGRYEIVTAFLKDYREKDVLLDSIYLWNEKTDIILSSEGDICQINDFPDQEVSGLLTEHTQGVLLRSMTDDRGKTKETLTCIVRDEENGRYVLVINLNLKLFEDRVGVDLERTETVLEKTGQIVVGKEGNCKYTKEGSKYYVSWRRSEVGNWFYMMEIGYEEALSAYNIYSRMVAVIAILLIALEILVAFLLAKKIYIPLRKLVRHAKAGNGKAKNIHNEYEFLNGVLSEMEEDFNEMKSARERYRKSRRDEILQKMLYGDISRAEVEEESRESGLIWSKKVFCVVCFSFNHLETVKGLFSRTEMQLFCSIMINALEEYLAKRGCIAYGTEDEDYAVSLILQLDEKYENSDIYALQTFPNENVTEIQKLLFDAKTEVEKMLRPATLFVSVGRSVTEYEEIRRSWIDTKYANIYRFTRGTRRIVLFTEHMETYESGIPYPMETEKKLLYNIKAGNISEILTTLEEFFDAIRKMAPDEMKWAMNQAMTSIFKVSMINEYRMKDGSPLDWKSWTNRLNATDTADEMKEVLIQLLSNLSVKTADSGTEKRKTAERVRDYVDGHYCDNTITVTEIAEKIGLSVNYTRQIFKACYGLSISDYITDRRIGKAEELLLNSSLTGKEIAERVGYSDNRYFYVVFKKKTGETAEGFRRKRREDKKDHNVN